MSAIAELSAREVLDSRGNPTVEVDLRARLGCDRAGDRPLRRVDGPFEATELRDGGDRYGGKGVRKAVANVDGEIAAALGGLDALDQRAVDLALIDLDGTPTSPASAPTRSSASRWRWRRRPPTSWSSASTATSAGSTPTCCRCR